MLVYERKRIGLLSESATPRGASWTVNNGFRFRTDRFFYGVTAAYNVRLCPMLLGLHKRQTANQSPKGIWLAVVFADK